MGPPVVDTTEAVELAPRVWWVGSLLPDDRFQCHVYLVEQGDQSVLIDPGSALTADEVARKVDSVVGLDNVRWLVCSHQDPDIIGALPSLVARGLHPDAAIVTHWRDEALIVHSGTSLPFWRIEDHDWNLPLADRRLRFVFTPYAHFAGAFCTFDESSGTLFSSDLFGGFTDDSSLYARSVDYFDAMRAFHEHYMPSREVLAHAVEQLRPLPITQIAPQHGQVIPSPLVAPIMDQLETLECGIYLLSRDDPGLRFLLTANRTMQDIVDTLVGEPDFAVVAAHLAGLASDVLGAHRLELWVRGPDRMLEFEPDDGFAGHASQPPDDVLDTLSGIDRTTSHRVLLPLWSEGTHAVNGVAVLDLATPLELQPQLRALLEQIAGLIDVGLEREVLRRVADLERAALYDRAIHDSLTGLHNRMYLADAAHRLCAIDDREGGGQVAALMIDVDHFKIVNDTFGHPVGDLVLQHVARSISASIRPGDVAVRFGGEEFLVLVTGADTTTALAVGERIRAAVAEQDGDRPPVTASVGIARRRAGEACDALVARADEALYLAKAGGRDRVDVAA